MHNSFLFREIMDEISLFKSPISDAMFCCDRDSSDIGKTAVAYKSEKRAELEAEGYRIHGSSGDQWSDLLGLPMAARSFKLPNPMYYIC
jgi:HAD superfamily, subfamily IIIB (Acid phosphatase)